jgi:hypothetical protein
MSIGQGEDEAAGNAADGGLSGHAMDRRSLIKTVGIAGAAAWVAPVVIESMVSPASAASVNTGTYALRLSSEQCNPTPVLDPNGAPPPVKCTPLNTQFLATDHLVTDQATLDALGITVDNCRRRYLMAVSTTNPKVTFNLAGSGSAGLHKGNCVTPALTPNSVTWQLDGASDRLGYFIIFTVSA